MIHIPNRRHQPCIYDFRAKVSAVEYKAPQDSSEFTVRLSLGFSDFQTLYFYKTPAKFMAVPIQKILEDADKVNADTIPTAEIISAQLHIEPLSQIDAKECFLLALYRPDNKNKLLKYPFHSPNKYDFDVNILEPRYIIAVLSPKRYSISKFKEMMRLVNIYLYVRMRRLRSIEVSPDYTHFRTIARPAVMTIRYFIIKAANIELQKFVESTKTDEDIIARVNAGTLCAYYDANPTRLSDAIHTIMSIVHAPKGYVFDCGLMPAANCSEEYVYYTQILDNPPQKCNKVTTRYQDGLLCNQIPIRELVDCVGWVRSYEPHRYMHDYPSSVASICYFCDGIFPFHQFKFKYELVFE